MGLLDGSNLLAYEQILIDAEIAASVRRLLQPVPFDAEDFALALIDALGPGGVYMDQIHTIQQMRRAISVPLLSDRDSYDDWADKGQRSRVQVARQKVTEILATHQPPPLPESTREELRRVVTRHSRGRAG